MASIKQIESFKSKYLRMAGFVEYVQQVLKLFTDFRNSGEEGVSQLPVKVEPAYTSYKDSVTAVDDAYKLSRSSDFTQKIADEDDRRDNLYRQLVNLLKMYSRFGYDTEKKAAADYLWNIVKKYGVDPDENYSEESGKLQQMLQELESNAQAAQRIAGLGIENLITQLNTANEQVRTLMSNRNDERMQVEKAALATARENADQAYRDLILSLNASAVMDDDAHRFDDLISQVNELIKYYRQYVVPKGARTSANEEGGTSTPSEGGSGSGSSTGSGSGSSTGESNGSGTGSGNGSGSSEGSGTSEENGSSEGSGSGGDNPVGDFD
jgi:hypothetical protein